MLRVENLHAAYADSPVLHGISLSLDEGEVVTLLGRNGMGKSTTLHCICGLLPIRDGAITFNQQPLAVLPSYRIARLGIGLVPEARHIFSSLNVLENLQVAAANYSSVASPWTLKTIFELFPRLEERAFDVDL